MGKKKSVDETEGGATLAVPDAPDAGASAERGPVVPEGVSVGDTLTVANLTEGTHEIPLALIATAKNPRELFDLAELEELASLMQSFGQEQAIGVYRMDEPDAEGRLFVLIAGERRVRAAMLNQWQTIRAEIRPRMSDKEAYIHRIIENCGRADLSAMEKAKAYVEVLGYFNGDKKQAAVAVGLRSPKAKADSDEGIRVFEQTMQFATSLIIPAMEALAKGPKEPGGISAAHAAHLCRLKDGKHQAEMLAACFEPRAVFNGATHETEPVLISEKELRGKIAARFPKEENRQTELFTGATNGVAKDKNDLDREHQAGLEEQANGMLDRVAAYAPNTGENTSQCGLCGGDIKPGFIGQVDTNFGGDGPGEWVPGCQQCYEHQSETRRKNEAAQTAAPAATEAPKAKDDDAPQDPPESNDYEKLCAERLDRLGKAFDGLAFVDEVSTELLRQIALRACPPMMNYPAVARMFGAGMEANFPNHPPGAPACGVKWQSESKLPRSQWANGTLRAIINTMADKRDRAALVRVLYILLYLPSINPNHPDDDLKILESTSAPKTEAVAAKNPIVRAYVSDADKAPKLQMRSGKPVRCKRNIQTGELAPYSGPKVSDGWEVGNMTEDGDFVLIVNVKPKPTKKSHKPAPKKSDTVNLKKQIESNRAKRNKPTKKKAKK